MPKPEKTMQYGEEYEAEKIRLKSELLERRRNRMADEAFDSRVRFTDVLGTVTKIAVMYSVLVAVFYVSFTSFTI